VNPGRSRSILAGLCVLALAFILAACIQIDVESEFEPDGSANHSMELTVDRALLDGSMLDGELDADLDFEELEREAEAAGLETERIDTADRVGVRVSKFVEDNEDLSEVLNSLFDSAGGDGPPVDAFRGGFTQSSNLGGSTYQFELSVDGDSLFEERPGELDGEAEEAFDFELTPSMLGQFMNLTYTVRMPGEVREHNGSALGTSSVQWTIPFEGTQTFYAESQHGSGFSLALILGVGLGSLALLLIVVGGIMMMRGQKSPTVASTPDAQPGSMGQDAR
jgi:hypothetical protein